MNRFWLVNDLLAVIDFRLKGCKWLLIINYLIFLLYFMLDIDYYFW